VVPITSVTVGDRVLFSKYGPSEIKVEGKEFLIAREDDILAILETK
jgi:chaperonin GroES